MPLDLEVAQRLRYVHTPVILVMNKADTPEFDHRGGEFYKLGRGKPIAVSTHQNRNKKALLKLIEEMLPKGDDAKPADAVMKIAVVGRPNTGKSTFINTLAQAERMIVSERPGTTRDSVDVRFELDGLPFLAIDTAGVRRKAKIRDSLDFYSIHRAERSIRRADVVLLFLDPTQGISRLDKQLADYIAKQYKPCIFAVNKWDLMAPNADGGAAASEAMRKYAHLVQHAFRSMSYTPLAFITATDGQERQGTVEPVASRCTSRRRNASAPARSTACSARPSTPTRPPCASTRTPRIYYATQVSTAPPTIVLFVNQHVALRPDLSALPAERLPREAAVPRHPDQALPPLPDAIRDLWNRSAPDLTADQGSRVDPARGRSRRARRSPPGNRRLRPHAWRQRLSPDRPRAQ